MAILAADRDVWTFEQFCERIPDGMKADLIDGVIYVASPDNLKHYETDYWLAEVLNRYLRKRKIKGRVFGFRIAFRLDDENGPEPDLAYVCPERVHLIRKTHIQGPPDWALEIVSPSSVERDYEKKLKQFERFGVREYWIIDPLEERMSCYRLGKNGKYKEVRARDGKMHSQAIPGFWVKPEWFWMTPLPDEDVVLPEILAAANGKT
jgi:Uma2 family endonuclease